MIDFIDKTSEQSGTPLNRENMMAIQGFINSNITINKSDNVTVITNTNAQGHTTTTTITVNEDKSITVVEVFVGEKTITKTTTINAAVNNISEVVS